MIVLIFITGCSGAKAKVEEEVVQNEVVQGIKEVIWTKVAEIEDPFEENGILTPETYIVFASETNSLSMAINANIQIQYNNTEHIEESIEMLKQHIESMSDDELLAVQSNIDSPAIIYTAAFEEYFTYYLNHADIKNGSDSIFNLYFSSMGQNIDDINAVKETATTAVEQLATLEKYPSDKIIILLNHYKASLPETDYDLLVKALTSIDLSVERQMAIMDGFATGQPSGDVDELNEAMELIERAREALADFQENETQ